MTSVQESLHTVYGVHWPAAIQGRQALVMVDVN